MYPIVIQRMNKFNVHIQLWWQKEPSGRRVPEKGRVHALHSDVLSRTASAHCRNTLASPLAFQRAYFVVHSLQNLITPTS